MRARPATRGGAARARRKGGRRQPAPPQPARRPRAGALARAHFFARDLINTPANDLGPQHLACEAEALAAAHPGAGVSVISGEALLAAGYPAVHTVGRASAR